MNEQEREQAMDSLEDLRERLKEAEAERDAAQSGVDAIELAVFLLEQKFPEIKYSP